MSAVFVQKQGPGEPFGAHRVTPRPRVGSGSAPVVTGNGTFTALQNPEATIAEIRDALLIEAGFPPVG